MIDRISTPLSPMLERVSFTKALMAAAVLLLALALNPLGGPGSMVAADSAEAMKPGPRVADRDKGRIYHDDCIVLGSKVQSPYRECVYGHARSDKHVVLFGDSHALQYGPTMIRLARQNGWRLTALVRQGCLIAQVRYQPVCDKWRRNTMRRIARRERPDLIVVSSATTNRYALGNKSRLASQPALVRGMVKTLRRLRDTGARVALIRDQHQSPRKLPRCIWRTSGNPNRACGFRPDSRRRQHEFDYTAARSVKHVRVIDPAPKFCAKSFCPVVKGGILLYRDRYHITATYARLIAPWLGRQLPHVSKWK